MSQLLDESGFSELLEHYRENTQKPWNEWLEVVKVFPRPGKQGYAGVVRSKLKPHLEYVFKVSRYINYLPQHELTVMQSLSQVASFTPHFCQAVGLIKAMADMSDKDTPLKPDSTDKYLIEKDVLLMQNLQGSFKLCNYIYAKEASEQVVYSVIKQILCALCIAQKQARLAHYDLHSDNIMVRKCSKDLVFLYILSDSVQFYVPTHGYYGTVIDYGFGYAQGCDGQPLWASLNYTETGFMSDRFDSVADPKLFLVSASAEMEDSRNTKSTRRLRNFVRNLYGRLPILWDAGWDTDTKKCATRYVIDILEPYSQDSKIFSECSFYFLDIIQSLIKLPLKPQKYDGVHIAFSAFLKEFAKVEREIGSEFFCLYILQGIVNAAREVETDYRSADSRKVAIAYFRSSILERISSIASYCNPSINYELMLCSLLCCVRGIEGILYDAMLARELKKRKMYEKIPLQSTEEIVLALEVNIPSRYAFSEKTSVMIMDARTQTCSMKTLTATQATELNEYSSEYIGGQLFKIFSS